MSIDGNLYIYWYIHMYICIYLYVWTYGMQELCAHTKMDAFGLGYASACVCKKVVVRMCVYIYIDVYVRCK